MTYLCLGAAIFAAALVIELLVLPILKRLGGQ